MKKIILDVKTGVLLCCLFLVTTLSVKAQVVSLTASGSNVLSISNASLSGSVYSFNVVMPYYETNAYGIFNLINTNPSFVCITSGSAQYMTLHKSDGTVVSNSSNSNIVSFLATLPVGSYDYIMRSYCTRPGLSPTLRSELKIRINVIKETIPNVNLSFAPYCKFIPDTQQHSGYIGFNVTGDYSNAGNLYLRVANAAAACPTADYKVTLLHSSGAPTAVINPIASFYDCDALTNYTIKLVYKATSVSGMIMEQVISSGNLGWNDYSWQKTIHDCRKIVIGPKSVGMGVEFINTEAAQVKVYPNPTNNDLNIAPAEGKEIRNAKVIDPSGFVYESKAFRNGKGEQSINLSHLKPGIYFVEIETNEGVFVEKVVKN